MRQFSVSMCCVRTFRVEPFVEICRTVLIGDSNDARAARLNSPRLIGVAAGEGKSFWAADLQQHAAESKQHLVDKCGPFPIVESRSRCKQLRLRFGQRFWRDPVPTDVVSNVQNPNRGLLTKSAENSALVELFDALYGIRSQDGRVMVVAMIREGVDRQAAETNWQSLMRLISEKLPDAVEFITSKVPG